MRGLSGAVANRGQGRGPLAAAGPMPREPAPPSGGAAPFLSIVVPVLNEAATLPALLDRLERVGACAEVVVVDGGSTDASAAVVTDHPSGARLVASEPGRAQQCNAGAARARGSVLLFFHADSRMPSGGVASIERACADPEIVGGNFAVRYGDYDRFSLVLSLWGAIQRWSGVYYGDSGIWVRRTEFERMGGFAPLEIMEDYEFTRRLERRGKTAWLRGPLVTSPRRWKRLGLPRTILSWLVIKYLFLAGVPADRLARLYRRTR